MIRISIRYIIHSVSELEPVLGMCRCYNSAIDLQQEGPYFLSCIFLAESDSGVTRTKKKLRGGTPGKILVAYFSW